MSDFDEFHDVSTIMVRLLANVIGIEARLHYINLCMAHLPLLQSTIGFVLLLAGIYAFLWGLWFLGVRFVLAWPFISLVRQTDRERSRGRGYPASLLNEYLKRRRDAQASGRCPSCGKALVVRIDSKGRFSKPECPECSAEARAQSRLRRR